MTRRAVELTGEVCSGLGEGRAFTALDWFIRECRIRLGFTPYPGTFNLRISSPLWPGLRRELMAMGGIRFPARGSFCAASCFRATLAGAVETAMVFPDVPDYPADKIELLAATPLRRDLEAADGDTLGLRIHF